MDATIREVREEVGLLVELLTPHKPDYVIDFITNDLHFVLLVSSAVVL